MYKMRMNRCENLEICRIEQNKEEEETNLHRVLETSKMMYKLPLFLLGVWLCIIPPSHGFPDTKANDEDGLDEQLLGNLLAAERERGLTMDKAENPGRNIPENEDRKETVQKLEDTSITRVDVTEKGQIVEQRYRDCKQRNEVIVMKPGTSEENCYIHYIDDTQYTYECENKGEKVEHNYEVTQEIKDKSFLAKSLGSSICQNAPLHLMEIIRQDKADVSTKDLKLEHRGCTTYCCSRGWWGGCSGECINCT